MNNAGSHRQNERGRPPSPEAVQPRYDKDEVKRRLPMLDLLAKEGVSVRRAGPHYLACCPFHEEKTGSFTVYVYDDPSRDHAHCFGCGWNGDIFKFVMERRGVVFLDALAECASLATVSPAVRVSWVQKVASRPPPADQTSSVTRVADATDPSKKTPPLPRLRGLREEEIEALARMRGLDVAGVALAAQLKRVGFCEWPQWQKEYRIEGRVEKVWERMADTAPCWFVTDSQRRVIQYRRLDGKKFEKREGKAIKAWTKGSPTWPLGASEMGDRGPVLLVEGGADMLAAYHFLEMFGRVEKVAVVAMLGASCAICDDALPFFKMKRVRIVMDVDEPNRKTGKIPSFEAAARWTAQLTQVGAAVESFSLAGLTRKDGEPVKDLNDLAMVQEDAWLDPELRALFFDFDF